jgi:cobalt-zinc-cadmium efflux system outer membrane protein
MDGHPSGSHLIGPTSFFIKAGIRRNKIKRENIMKLLMHSLQLAITVLLAVCLSSQVQGEETKPPSNVREALRLEDLERMALEKNPTLAQAGALVREAEGRKTQAGLYPNPTFGYSGEEITVRHPSDKSQHSLFIEQKIITGGKLQRSREIFAREQAKAEADLQAQRQRVLNMVRIIFFKVMGAQRLVELRGELARIAREAVGITEELFNIGQADQPDILEAEIEAQRAELDLINAENELQRVWQMLAGVVGEPALPKMGLLGDLEIEIPKLDQETIFTRILEESPEIQSARASGERAKAALERAKVQPIPDVSLRGGLDTMSNGCTTAGGRAHQVSLK